MIEDVAIVLWTFALAINVWNAIGSRLHALNFAEIIAPYSEYIMSLEGQSLGSCA